MCVQDSSAIQKLSVEQGMYNHAFYLESACFILGLAAVHDRYRESTDLLLKQASRGLQMLQRLGPREPAQSIGAAVAQMINRIRALPTRISEHSEITINSTQPSTATISQADQANSLAVLDAAHTTTHDSSAYFGWGTETLDDLWSMMDWNVGFTDSDPLSFVPTRPI